MKYDVTISQKAEENLDAVFEYLEANWSEKVRDDFKQKLIKEVDYLRQNPFMFPASQIKKGVRKCLITNHNTLYYKVEGNEEEIITIHDTRKNPKSLKI